LDSPSPEEDPHFTLVTLVHHVHTRITPEGAAKKTAIKKNFEAMNLATTSTENKTNVNASTAIASITASTASTVINDDDDLLLHPPYFGENIDIVESIDKGKGLVASRSIPKGELLFSEMPLFTSTSGHHRNVKAKTISLNTCDQCGRWCTNVIDQLESCCTLAGDLLVPAAVREELAATITSNDDDTTTTTTKCERCNVQWCSEECQKESLLHGHDYLCTASIPPHGLLHQLQTQQEDLGRASHFGLAAKVFARVAARVARSASAAKSDATNGSTDSLTTTSSEIVHSSPYDKVVGTFSDQRYTESIHAVRTGSLVPPPASIFHSMLQPAYFESHALACASTVLKNIFQQSLKSTNNSAVMAGASYVLECLENNERFDRLMGTMKCNNFQIDIPSPLALLLSSSSSSSQNQGHQLPITLPLTTLFVDQVLRPAIGGQLPRVLQTAMFRLGAHLNHDCIKNTRTRPRLLRGGMTNGIEVWSFFFFQFFFCRLNS
jgi:hypothetical protein